MAGDKPIRPGRRKVLGDAAGAAALAAAAHALLPHGALADSAAGPELTRLTLGFIPLTDCAPIVIAREKGFFRKHGLYVALSREASWANIRDKVIVGTLDGAHMLAPMPIDTTLGIGAIAKPTITAFSMDLNGNAITVSNALYDAMVAADPAAMAQRPISAQALKRVIAARKAAGRELLTFGMVFPVSTHNYELRYWLAAAGIDPDHDARLIVVPPPDMAASLAAGTVDGCCVGEPWNGRAVADGVGRTLITKYELWNNGAEKVFGVNQEWAERHPNTHRAVLRALLEAAQWMDRAEHRAEVARIIAAPAYVNAPEDIVAMSMTGSYRYRLGAALEPAPDFNVFFRYAATFPWRSHALWFLSQMVRWGQIGPETPLGAVAGAVYRPDLYREAAADLGLPCPTGDAKTEGSHAGPWTLTEATAPIAMGADRFFDGRRFDPADIDGYLRDLRAAVA